MTKQSLTFADSFGGIFHVHQGVENVERFVCRTCMDHRHWSRVSALVTAYDSGTYTCSECNTKLTIKSGMKESKPHA